MAERYTREEAPLVIHPTETSINEHFNKLIDRLNQRREEMIHQFRERMEERRAVVTTRQNMLQQLIDSKADLQGHMKENPLHSMRERMTEEIDTKMRDLQVTQKETEVVFECDTTQLEQTISVLGQLVEREIVSTTDYPALQQPSVSVAKQGTAEGELYWPRGVAFDEKSQRIYVTNAIQFGGNISVFSVTGEYIDRVCERPVGSPSGIAISGDDVFVSDTWFHCVFKFEFPTFISVSKVGKRGTGVGKFHYPNSLTVEDGYVYVADHDNNRIAVMSTGLQHSNYITHQTMTSPRDVRVNNNQLYVLSYTDSPCLHVFSLTGEKIRSLITLDRDGNAQVRRCLSFCLDKKVNILMADYGADNIKVFSQEGALLHTLGNTLDGDKTIRPYGIALTDNNKIICTSFNTNFLFHIF